jgi:HEAT repeat protein
MNWLTFSPKGEAKKLVAQLADPTKRDIAARELTKMGADSVPPLIDALQIQDLNLIPYYQQVLARIPSSTLPLTQALRSSNPVVRARVAETLGMSNDRSAIPALLDILKDENYSVRSSSVIALGNIGDAQVIPFLLPLLKDKDAEVRSAACAAIAKFHDPASFDKIANVLLYDPMIEVRQSAAIALGDTKHPAAIPFLMEALRDSQWWFEREQVAKDLLRAIEKMGPAAVEPLIEALRDKEVTVRKFAATVLGNLCDDRALDELGMTLYDLHHEVSQAAALALTKFGSKAVDILLEALNHPEAGIRECAISALGKIQDVRVAPVLIEMLHDPERIVRIQIIKSLGELHDQRALPALQEIASNRADRELSILAKQILEGLK